MKAVLYLLCVICGSIALLAHKPDGVTKEKLGEKLFFDPLFSEDLSISCASCHIPQFAFADTLAFSIGVGGKKGKRNAPSVMNMAARSIFFYDGRAGSLRDQIHFPVEDPLEMNFSLDLAAQRINTNTTYQDWFKDLYQSSANPENIADALATYIESLETSNTLFDNYMQDKYPVMDSAAIRGRAVFMSEKAKCFDCHFSPDFTGDEFKNIGLFDGKELTDSGRYRVTKDPQDLGAFKVPGLRNVALTAPYMHNGMFTTLEQVVQYYNNPFKIVPHPINIDSTLQKPLGLSAKEQSDLIAFLNALTDLSFVPSKD